MYVFEKTVATFGTFALLYTMTENFILPLVPTSKEQPFIRSLLDLALPFMLSYLLLFYIIFGVLSTLRNKPCLSNEFDRVHLQRICRAIEIR